MNALLAEVSDKFKTMPDGIQKTAMMVELFGKNGANLNEFLSLGSKGLREFQEKAEKLGLAIGADAAAAGDKFNDTLNDLKAAALGLSLSIGQQLLPYITQIAVVVSNAVVKFREFIEQHQVLTKAALGLGAVFGTGGSLLIGLAGLLTLLPKISTAWATLNAVMAANPVGFVVVAIATLVTALIVFRNEIAGGLAKAYAFLLSGLASIVDAASRAAHALGMNGLGNTLSSAGNSIRGFANNLADMGKQLLANEPAVIDNTAAIERYKATHQTLPPIIKETTGAVEKNSEAFKAQMDVIYKVQMGLYQYHMALARLADDTELLQARNGDLLSSMKVPELPTLPPVGGRQISVDNSLPKTAVIDLANAMSQAQDRANDLANKIKDLRNAGYDDATITAYLASQLSQAADDAEKFHTALDPAIQDIIRQQKATKDAADEAKKWRDVWTQAMGNVVSGFAKGVTDMIFHAKSFKDSVIGIFKQLGESLVQTLVTDAFTRIAKGFEDMLLGKDGKSGILGGLGGLKKALGDMLHIPGQGTPGVIMNATGGGSSIGTGVPSSAGGGGGIGSFVNSANLIANIGGAIGSIGSFVEGRRMEGTLNAVEYNTRASMIHLYFILTDTTAHIRDTMFEVKDLLVEIAGDAGELLDGFKRFYDKSFAPPAPASTGQASAQVATAGGSTVYNTFSIENVNVELTGDSFDDTLAVRNKLLPKIIEAVKLNSGGAGTALKEALA